MNEEGPKASTTLKTDEAPGTASSIDKRRTSAWHSAIHAYATGYIFQNRQRQFGNHLRWVAFIGLGVPVLVGAVVLTFGTGAYLNYVLVIGGILGVIQVVISLWSLIAKWDLALAYASESASANYTLSKRFKSLAENPPDDFERRLEILEAENQQREQADYKQDIADTEKRMGHRAALREFARKCAGCGEVPKSLTPTNCDICGNF